MTLSDKHLTMLRDGSGLRDETIAARGYRTVTQSVELLALGFAPGQTHTAQLPGLLIPIYAPDGSNHLYQYRPDNPRVKVDHSKRDDDGERPNKTIKYETPKSATLRLDVSPICRDKLANLDARLWITEGIKKADAIAQCGDPAIGLLGVWNWRDGKSPLADWESVPLKGRAVVIAYDNDVAIKSGPYQAMRRLKKFLESRGAIVKVIYLPMLHGEKMGVDDFLATGKTIDELFAFASELHSIDPASLLNAAVAKSTRPDLPGIIVTAKQLRDTTIESISAVVKRNTPPLLFVRTGAIVRLLRTERETPQVETVSLPTMRLMLSDSANYFSFTGEKLSAAHTPRDVAESVLALGQWPFPVLLGVTACPQVKDDGSPLTVPGYDATSQTIYAPTRDLVIGSVAESPTADDVKRAVETIAEPFAQFPFVGDSDRANFIGLLLTPILRSAIDGPVPLALITATTPGTGKSLLSRAAVRLATGSDSNFAAWPDDETELRKFITSTLSMGGPFVVFDNISKEMRSDVLSQALTCETWQDRLLGGNVLAELPNRAIWIATGNNLSATGDLARRCYRIALDANLPQPWERSGFEHTDLIGYLADRRGSILAALLTLARAWYNAGWPAGDMVPMGSFENWSRVIGGILQYAGVPGFLGNRGDAYDDTESQEWMAFFVAWHAHYGRAEKSTGDVIETLKTDAAFAALLPDDLQDTFAAMTAGNTKASLSKQLGAALKRVKGRLFGTNDDAYKTLSMKDKHTKKNVWWVERLNSAGSAGSATAENNPTKFLTSKQKLFYDALPKNCTDSKLPSHYPHYPQIADGDDVQIIEPANFVERADAWLNVMP